jgi:hypothetical protein
VIAATGSAHADIGAVSPGKLARAHAALETQCSRCHVPFGGIPQRQCLACHTALAERTAQGIGFHASVAAQPCTDCHKEHHGREAPLAPAPPAAFDHRTTRFRLDGDHARLACERCHPATGASRRWVGLATACQSCHVDRVHRGALGGECERCHRASGWIPALFTGADHRTSLAGGHAPLACSDCHQSGGHLAPRQSCATCHARPHGGTSRTCETCHRVAAWNQVSYTHAAPLTDLPGRHQTAPCLACHPAFRFAGTSRTCAACHAKASPHEPLGGCADCHSPLTWKGARFDHDRPSVGFPLTGGHRTATCARCHAPRNGFRSATRACDGCHRDPHSGQFARMAGKGTSAIRPPAASDSGPSGSGPSGSGPSGSGMSEMRTSRPIDAVLAPLRALIANGRPRNGCAECHRVAAWRPSTISVGAHTAWFALRGAHVATACRGCHGDGRFVGAPRACSGCHPDRRHRGRFGSDCEGCHDETAWAPARGFDHARTGFALDQAHARVGCADCHGRDGMRFAGVAAPTACQTCHAPPHGKQFGSRCTGCHSTASFRAVPAFDHAARTDFPLELRHAALPCLQCHDARQRPVVHRACRTCHGDPHRGSNAFDCSDCHRADRWRLVRFDHDLTSYPLVGRHRLASCGGCHSNPNWTGVRTDCVACHALDRPRDADHTGELTCDDCHTLATWRVLRPGPSRRPRAGAARLAP